MLWIQRSSGTAESLKECGVKDLGTIPKTQSPVLPITFTERKQRFPYFSLITTVGTPRSVTAQELAVWCMFPVQDEGK